VKYLIFFLLLFVVDFYALGGFTKSDVFSKLNRMLSQNEIDNAVKHLDQSLDQLSGLELELAHYSLGLLALKQDRLISAEKSFNKVTKLNFFDEDLVYLDTQIKFRKGNYKDTIKALEGLSEAFTNEQKGHVEFLKGMSHLNMGDSKKALKNLKPLIKKWRKKTERADLLETLLASSVSKKTFSKAKYCDWFYKLYTDHPGHKLSQSWSYESTNHQIDDKDINCKVDLAKKRSRLITSYRKGMSEKIKSDLALLTDEDLQNQLSIDFNYLSGNMDKALELTKLVYGKSLYKNPRILKRFARYNYYAGNYEDSLSGYEKTIDLYKNPRQKAYQLYYLSRLNINLNKHDEADNHIERLESRFKNTPYFLTAKWYKAWNYYLSGKYEEAYESLSALSLKFEEDPKVKLSDKNRVRYWMARTLQKAGEEGKAVMVYKKLSELPNPNYYSLLSSLRLNKIFGRQGENINHEDFLSLPWRDKNKNNEVKIAKAYDAVKLSVRTPSALHIGTIDGKNLLDMNSLSLTHSNFEGRVGESREFKKDLNRFNYYSSLGFMEESSRVLKSIEKRAKTKELKQELLDKYTLISDYSGLSRSVLRNFSKERYSLDKLTSKNFWRHSYPESYKSTVEESAKHYGVPAELIWAHIRAESFYNPRAVSPVGARGLLQIMPYTAEKIFNLGLVKGSRNFASVESKSIIDLSNNLMEPDLNIRVGASYLKRLQSMFNGNYPLMAAAYNGGPHRVKMWSSQYGMSDMDEFIERIPFSETRSYVKKIIFYKYIYSSLYGEYSPDAVAEVVEPLKFTYSGEHPTKENWDPL